MSARLPHEVYPAPDAEAGTAAEWSTYHLVRACAYSKLLEYVISGEDPQQMGSAVLGFLGEFAQAFLLARVTDDDARELAGLLAAGDVPPELTWDWLAEQGIDPETIARFSTFDESAAKRAERGAR